MPRSPPPDHHRSRHHRGGGGGGADPYMDHPGGGGGYSSHHHPPPMPPSSRSKSGYGSYRILLVSNLNYKVNDSLMRQALEDEFGRFGDLTVKLTQEAGERVAYLYFRSYEEAKEARHAKSRMILFDKPIHIEPIVEEPPPRRKRTPSPQPPIEYHHHHHGHRGAHHGGGGMSPPPPPMNRRRPPSIDRMPPLYHHTGGGGGHHPHRGEHHHVTGAPPGPPPPPPPFRRTEKKEKFPNYLHHIPPEDDDKATRTLFVGNLEVTISEVELRRLFARYGIVEDIDVKRPPPGQGNAYAFIKFLNLDMAHHAKVELSGQYIGKFQCKIGYGKATPTTRVWVGGLGAWTSLTHLEREFDRFGAIRKIDYVKGDSYAYIQYDSIDAAQAACQEMRGFALGGPDKRLRVDFADPGGAYSSSYSGGSASGYPNGGSPAVEEPGFHHHRQSRRPQPDDNLGGPGGPGGGYYGGGRLEDGEYSNGSRKRPHTPENGEGGPGKYSKYGSVGLRRSGAGSSSPDGKRARSFSPGKPGSAGNNNDLIMLLDADKEVGASLASTHGRRGAGISIAESVASIAELAKCCPVAWNGCLILKSSSFSTRMLLCSGHTALVDQLLMKTPCLRITQRLRLDQSKLEDVRKRVTSAGPEGSCILLTMAGGGPLPPEAGEAQARPLKNLVSYLKQKEAAGVVPLTAVIKSTAGDTKPLDKELPASTTPAVLYAFPPCVFAFDLLKKVAPNLSDATNQGKDDYLVVVVVKGQ